MTITIDTLSNISLLAYFALVSLIGTLGNGVILLAYGNRWNSSKSTSIIFILILACVDLWTCVIVVPAIAFMEYRDFQAPTWICRFYSFSKILIMISSFIMSFIAFDRFLTIALPHQHLLNPRRVKCLLTVAISIGMGLGLLTALAFSSKPTVDYIANYTLTLDHEPYSPNHQSHHITLPSEEISSANIIEALRENQLIPNDSNISNLSTIHLSTIRHCFADTSIISETIREILKHINNKFYFISIGIVTVLYSITFVLALRRQNPRIQALKKSINVLNKFDAYPRTSGNDRQRRMDSIVSVGCNSHRRPSETAAIPRQITVTLNGNLDRSSDALSPIEENQKRVSSSSSLNRYLDSEGQHYEMSSFLGGDDSDEQNLPSSSSPSILRKLSLTEKKKRTEQKEQRLSGSEATLDELQQQPMERLNGSKTVSFQLERHRETQKKKTTKQKLSISSTSFDGELDRNTDPCYKLPCPCSTSSQLLITFHFSRPPFSFNKWLPCCSCWKKVTQHPRRQSIINSMEDEIPITATNQSNSDTLRRQLHRHRLKQIRMASTFLIITVSFVLFYLPSVLNAERMIMSPLNIYYLFLCTHALNPIIYCFMNPSLRKYVFSIFKCRTRGKRQSGRINGSGPASLFER